MRANPRPPPRPQPSLTFSEAFGIRPLPDWLASPCTTALHLSGGRWQTAPHLELVSRKVAAMRDRPIRLIVNEPPRHGKSEQLSHWTPVWFLANWPDRPIILASYEAGFAASWGRRVRNTIEEHAEALGIAVAADSSAASEWQVAGHAGGMVTAGVGGPITGRGASLLIIDDPVKNAAEAASPVYREKAKEWWRSTAFPRLEPGASVVLIQTRWHEDDLAGYLLKTEPERWDLVSLPAIAGPGDMLGRPEGEALWPVRYDLPALATIRETVGPFWWAAEYQQRPQPLGGGIFHGDWWQYHELITLDGQLQIVVNGQRQPLQRVVQSWDTAFKSGQQADRSVCVTIGQHATGYAILDCAVGRWEYPDLERQAVSLYGRWRPRCVVVEDAASGQSLTQSLRRNTRLPVVPVKPEGDKVQRANTVTGAVEAGRVSLPAQAPWLADFLGELGAFPTAEHDDIVDAFVHGLRYLITAAAGPQVFL
uniref:Putative terminase n=1 Tax=viral metagenome TaxID=1070528 RepID=A0A6M3IGE3_9ZZZZ